MRNAPPIIAVRWVVVLRLMYASLGGLDALVFTAGVGEPNALIRELVCRAVDWPGVERDAEANTRHATCISVRGSQVSAWVIPTNEELMFALHARSDVRVARAFCLEPGHLTYVRHLPSHSSARPGGRRRGNTATPHQGVRQTEALQRRRHGNGRSRAAGKENILAVCGLCAAASGP